MRANFRRLAALVGVLGLAALVDIAAAADHTMRHSGTIVEIDAASGVLVLEEVGPWRVATGKTVVERVIIELADSTTFSSFIRVKAPGGNQGAFVQVFLDAEEVAPGEFVTVECLHTGNRMTALSVTVAELWPE